jgi:hypothetical protein
VIRECYKQFYNKKLDTLDEIDNLLERHKLPKPTQEEKETLKVKRIS